jgi:CRP/FNR family transcriptional regulator, anaerobic regulatory protein
MASSLTAALPHGRYREDAPSPSAVVEPLAGLGVTVSVAPGQTVVVEGDPIEYYYRILSGTVRLYKAIADGRRQILDFLGAGACFGLTALKRHGYSVEAVSRVIMVRYQRQSLQGAIQSDPQVACRLFELACRELGEAQHQMLLLGRKTAEERIASFLLSRIERQVDAGDDHRLVQLPISRQDMADYLGLTIETVSRTLSRFRRDGLIALPTPQQIELRKPDELQLLADGAL